MVMKKEIWKPVAGYEGRYEVSNFGRVKSLNYMRTGKEKILRLQNGAHNYQIVCLTKDGKERMHYIHRLVAEAFIPNPENLPQINHIDENRFNNCVENLEWCTVKYNINYGERTEKVVKKTTNGKKAKIVRQFSLEGDFVQDWPSLAELERQTGFHRGNVGKCCQCKYKSAYGFKWEYVTD